MRRRRKFRSTRRRAALLEQGFVASDAAYTTWLRQQRDVALPWEDYATLFGGWVLFCLDDAEQVRNYLDVSPPPRGWKRWAARHVAAS